MLGNDADYTDTLKRLKTVRQGGNHETDNPPHTGER